MSVRLEKTDFIIVGHSHALAAGRTGILAYSLKPTAAELQFAELEAEEFAVPASVKRKLVVGDHIGALLRIGPAARDHHRDFGITELPGSENPGVASYNSNSAGLVR